MMIIEKREVNSDVFFQMIFDLLDGYGAVNFTVTGMSMWPFICHGRDQVIIERCSFERLKIGDIILVRAKPSKFLLHRVTRIDRRNSLVETTGDNNLIQDGWFDEKFIEAKVVKVIRKGKKIDCEQWQWKCLGRIWIFLLPYRRSILKKLVSIGRYKNAIRRGFLTLLSK